MPIVTLQRQFRELGRIRLGQQVEFEKNGKTLKRPEKLGTWRLTSPDRKLLEVAAEQYGGEVVAWPEAPDGDEYQLITTTDEIEILVPPGRSLSQWNEMWSGGGCQRRCDGEREWLRNTPCLCPADPVERNELAAKGEACKPTTRLQVILPKLPDLGTWLYVSHGYYAAVELAGTAELLAAAASGGRMLRASIYIDQRQVKRPGQGAKKFPVAAIRIHETMTQLLAGGDDAPALTGRMPAQLTTSAPLPADPSFSPPAEASTTPGTASASARGASAGNCPHPPERRQTVAAGVACGACGELLARRDEPGTIPGGPQSGQSPPAAANQQPVAGDVPPVDQPPAPTSLTAATARVGRLAIQAGIVERLDTDDDWAAFDDAMRARGIERLPLQESAEAVAAWNALGDRLVRGDFNAAGEADDPAGMCQAHQLPWKFVPAGTNRAGNKFRSFWTCPDRECSAKPTKAWRDRQPQKAGEEAA